MKGKFKRVLMLMLIFNMAVSTAQATVITTETKNKVEIGDGKEHGVSHGYDPNATWDDIRRDALKRYKKLRKEAIELEEIHRKSKDKKQRDKIAEELARIALEMAKNKADREYEDELRTHPDRPGTRPEEAVWRRAMRAKRMADLAKKQEELEKKKKKDKEKAKKVKQLKGIGSATVGEASDAHREVMEDMENQEEAKDELKEEGCKDPESEDDDTEEEDEEACNEIREEVSEATSELEESEGRFRDILRTMPPIILNGGVIFHTYEELIKIQKRYKKYYLVRRDYKYCQEDCDEMKEIFEDIDEIMKRDEIIKQPALEELQDEHRKTELAEPVSAELVVPDYLSKNTEMPFGNRDALPLAFGVYTESDAKNFKNVKVVVDGKALATEFYPEAGVIKALYVGYPQKHKFNGQVILESVDGKTFKVPFAGKINITKPKIKISKKGGTFSRAKFKVKVTGEFDKIEVTGSNIKPRVYKFDSVQSKKEFTVKTLSTGAAYINVKASLKTKLARVGEFDGPKLETDPSGRLINPESDLFKGFESGLPNNVVPFSPIAKKELGFCCEEEGELTCEGCIAGKRTRKSCKALNKLPGYDFKAFLKASDLTCTKL